MSTIEIELTDPSKELAALADIITKANGGGNVVDGLSKCVNIPVDDPDLLDVLAAVQRRIRDVEDLAKTVKDTDFDQEMRNDVLSAVRSFSQLVHPKNANAGWDQVRSDRLAAKNITALRFFSQTARRYCPLRVVPPKARDEVLERLADIIIEIEGEENLEDWRKTILVNGLKRVQLVLKHLPFFGHEAAITELWVVHQKVSLVVNGVAGLKKKSGGLERVLVVLGLAGSLFVLPADAADALNHYKTWMMNWSNAVLQIITDAGGPFEIRLLPAPNAISPTSNSGLISPAP
jgi:hypothetical protein